MPKEHLRVVPPPEQKENISGVEELQAKRKAEADASLYNSEGQVNDQEIAREMADIESRYRKRRLGGLLNPSKESVETGIKEAHKKGEHLQAEKEMHEPSVKILHELKEILLSGLEKNTILQNILKKSTIKLIDLISLNEDKLYLSVFSPYLLENWTHKPDERRHCNLVINFPENGLIEVSASTLKKSLAVKKYTINNKVTPDELKEDIEEWAEKSEVWVGRKGLI